MIRPSWPRLRRMAFWFYVPILFGATHWPKLTVGGPVGTDKSIHIVAFALWTALLIGAGYFGKPLCWRNTCVAGLIAAAYAAIDEGTQAIPWIHRSAEVVDFLANLKGVALTCAGTAAMMLLARKAPLDSGPVSSPPT